jgi:hypothetical protein
MSNHHGDLYRGTSAHTTSAALISVAARDLLRTLLTPVALKQGEGDFEIGREVTKLSIIQSLEAFTGGEL